MKTKIFPQWLAFISVVIHSHVGPRGALPMEKAEDCGKDLECGSGPRTILNPSHSTSIVETQQHFKSD